MSWTYWKTVPNLIVAEMWRGVVELGGCPVKILVDPNRFEEGIMAPHRLFVPRGKEFIAEEAMRAWSGEAVYGPALAAGTHERGLIAAIERLVAIREAKRRGELPPAAPGALPPGSPGGRQG